MSAGYYLFSSLQEEGTDLNFHLSSRGDAVEGEKVFWVNVSPNYRYVNNTTE